MMYKQLVKDERGTTLIEFTVVLVVLLALTFGMIDFGRYVYAISVVRGAAQEGARAAIESDVDATAAKAVAEGKLIALDRNRANVSVTKGSELAEATVTYNFQFITPLGGVSSLLSPSTTTAYSSIMITGTASMAIY